MGWDGGWEEGGVGWGPAPRHVKRRQRNRKKTAISPSRDFLYMSTNGHRICIQGGIAQVDERQSLVYKIHM